MIKLLSDVNFISRKYFLSLEWLFLSTFSYQYINFHKNEAHKMQKPVNLMLCDIKDIKA